MNDTIIYQQKILKLEERKVTALEKIAEVLKLLNEGDRE